MTGWVPAGQPPAANDWTPLLTHQSALPAQLSALLLASHYAYINNSCTIQQCHWCNTWHFNSGSSMFRSLSYCSSPMLRLFIYIQFNTQPDKPPHTSDCSPSEMYWVSFAFSFMVSLGNSCLKPYFSYTCPLCNPSVQPLSDRGYFSVYLFTNLLPNKPTLIWFASFMKLPLGRVVVDLKAT